MAGGNPIGKYQAYPVTGKQIISLHSFIHSEKPYQTLLLPGLLPGKATVAEMVSKCSNAMDRILEKYEKFKQAGVVQNDFQKLALGNLVEDIPTAELYEITLNWTDPRFASSQGFQTRKSLTEFLIQWFTYHKYRIGWSSANISWKNIRDPRATNPKKPKVIRYNLADRYNLPIKNCLIPYVQGDPNLAHLRTINLSVAQAEYILLHVLNRYVNENDLVEFSKDNLDERHAFTILSTLSRFRTETSQTFKGVIASLSSLSKIPEERKRRKRLELEKIKTEEDALKKAAELEAEKARRVAKLEEEERAWRERKFDVKEIIENSSLGGATSTTTL